MKSKLTIAKNLLIVITALFVIGACAESSTKSGTLNNMSSANRMPGPGYMYK